MWTTYGLVVDEVAWQIVILGLGVAAAYVVVAAIASPRAAATAIRSVKVVMRPPPTKRQQVGTRRG